MRPMTSPSHPTARRLSPTSESQQAQARQEESAADKPSANTAVHADKLNLNLNPNPKVNQVLTTNQTHRGNKRISVCPISDRPHKRRRRWCDTVEARSLANGIEDDAHRISQRQKQIDYGKNTIAYDRFIAACPRSTRRFGDPMTPLAHQKCSKRSFAGQITSWKKKVYAYVANLDKRLEKEGKRNDVPVTHNMSVATGSTLNQGVHQDQSAASEHGANDTVQSQTGTDASEVTSASARAVANRVERREDEVSVAQVHGQVDTNEGTAAVETVASVDTATVIRTTECGETAPQKENEGTDADTTTAATVALQFAEASSPSEDRMEIDMFMDEDEMDDIQLDDHGNVINSGSDKGEEREHEDTCANSSQVASARKDATASSIFDDF